MPQRFLRPGITNSDRWNSVTWQAQSLFIRLLTLVDDFGRTDGRMSVLTGQCFSVWNDKHPKAVVTPQETAALCEQLAQAGLIKLYEAEGKTVLQMLQWQERARSNKSKWPEFVSNPQDSAGFRSGAQESAAIRRIPQDSAASLVPRSSFLATTSSPSPSEAASGAEVELPAGFPATADEAKIAAAFVGCPEDFTVDTWNKAMGRQGRDAKDVPIRSWRHYLAAEWSFQKNRNAENETRNRAHTDRNAGTFNAEGQAVTTTDDLRSKIR